MNGNCLVKLLYFYKSYQGSNLQHTEAGEFYHYQNGIVFTAIGGKKKKKKAVLLTLLAQRSHLFSKIKILWEPPE